MSNLSPPSTGSAQGGGLSSVHHMRCHFRLAGEGVSKYRSSLNRKKLAIDAAAVCDLKLGELLANDPGVYLLRRVHLELGALLAEEGSEAQLAQRLGERLTGTIMLDVMRGGDNVLQFANQAEYVAQFIKDLLDGSAWEHWYYYPFARYRASSRPETLRRVLAENRPYLPQILAGLQRRGRIEALLNNGDPAQVAGWWAAIDSLGDTRQALQPLAAAVLDLAGRLNLWNGSPLSLSALLAEMESQQPALDWRDPRSLAATIFSAIAALVRRGRLRRPAEIKTVDLEAALRKLDWLDHKWLFDQLRHLAVEDSHPEEGSTPDLPLRKAGRPTARQSRLLHD